MTRIGRAIELRAKERRKSFVAYITAGDPHIDETIDLVTALAEAGVDIIELGVPFSDPLADGPTNQKAAERALAAGTDLKKILAAVRTLRERKVEVPLVLFSYLNPIFRMGYEQFAKEAAAAGVDGVLTVDLPPEEASEYRTVMQKAGLDTIFLASPTSDAKRLALVGKESSGFVYYVSRTGVTGAQKEISESLGQEMDLVRKEVKLPIMVGFGISTPEQAQKISAMGDGIIIGSAIVRLIEEAESPADRIAKVKAFAQSIRTVL